MTARTVIQPNAFNSRVMPIAPFGRRQKARPLIQPPHFRTGQDAAPVIDTVALEAVRALKQSDHERTAHYRSRGVRAITT